MAAAAVLGAEAPLAWAARSDALRAVGGGAGCDALPAWPTLQQLEGAGFVLDVSAAEVVVGQVLGVAGFLVFVPQAVKIARMRSVKGTSLVMVTTSVMATCLQLAVMAADTSPTFLACGELAFGRCFANTLPFQQVLWQATAVTGLFLTYMTVWRLESLVIRRSPQSRRLFLDGSATPRRRRGALLAAVCFALTMLALAAYVVLPFCLGPCSTTLPPLRDAAAAAATAFQVVVMLPQIKLLCQTGDLGSLSVLSVVGQGLGCFIYAADLLLERAEILSVMPFLVMGTECMIACAIAAFYGCRTAARSRCSTGGSLGMNTPDLCASPAGA